MATPVQMPQPGNTVEECIITAWQAEPGDTVAEGDILCAIETDKATFEVEAPAGGVLVDRFYADGDLVPVLTNIAAIGEAGEDVSGLAPSEGTAPGGAKPAEASPSPEPPAAEAAPESAPAPAAETPPSGDPAGGALRASPRARREAKQTGVDVQRVTGSGPHGRVLAEDVKAAAGAGGRMTPLAQAAAQTSGQVPGAGTGLGGRVRGRDLVAPEAASAGGAAAHAEEGGPTEIPYRGIRKLIGDRMAESLASHAQLTLNSSADASALLGFRRRVKEDGDQMGLPNITLGDLVAYAVAQVLPRFPEMNAVFDFQQERILQYRQVHLAVAVDTDRGLMVPVVPHAHAKSLAELSESVLAVAAECRSGSIDPERLQGGTFTITNLGAMGIESFTPVINSPQVAILGVCTIKDEVVRTTDGETAWQPRLGLSLTIDHRAVDGAPAARFLQAVVKGIENVELLLAG